jgi:glutathione S-transferase
MLKLYNPGACSMRPISGSTKPGRWSRRSRWRSKGERQTPEYLKLNPNGKVPALRLDDGDRDLRQGPDD